MSNLLHVMNQALSGEPFKFNGELHGFCPICKTKSVAGCRCFLGHQLCANGHAWYRCVVHSMTSIGGADHAKSTSKCHCNHTAYYRKEI